MTTHQDSPEAPRRTEAPLRDTLHTLTPLRLLQATAPSGAAIEFHKYSDSDAELSYWFGLLTAVEHNQAWKATRIAAHGDLTYWHSTIAYLKQCGWNVENEHAG